jgi:hypothetical protein
MQYFNFSDTDLDFQVLLESGDAVLMSFLEDQIRTLGSQEPLLVALRAYYLPDAYLALRNKGFTLSDWELVQIAQHSIDLLLTQADVILHRFCSEFIDSDKLLLANQELRHQLHFPQRSNFN